MNEEFKEKNQVLGKFQMAAPTDEDWDKYDTSKEFREFMEITKQVNGDEDKK